MYPILFQFGPLTIYSFGAFMALAALSAAWVVHAELKRRGYNTELASTMVFAAAIGGLLGARLLFIIEEWNNFLGGAHELHPRPVADLPGTVVFWAASSRFPGSSKKTTFRGWWGPILRLLRLRSPTA
jgi:hypothetical protein